MTYEEEIFKRTNVDINKLLTFGFIKDNNLYKYSKNIMNDTFRVDIEIDTKGRVIGKVYDLSFNEEYTNFRLNGYNGSFTFQVRDEFINLLIDIRNNCFTKNLFIYPQANRIAKQIQEIYHDDAEFEWEKYPGYATFRNKDSKKWYALIMNIDKSKLDKKCMGEVEIIDLKIDSSKISELLKQKGFYPSYHMNKNYWITIILDDTLNDDLIMELIKESYSYTILNKHILNNEWIIPANPKFFDIEKSLQESNTILWKQSTDIKVNDYIYLYVAKPKSAIMYKFIVLEVNIPYEYTSKYLNIKKAMKLKLVSRYAQDKLPLSKLKTFGITSIRGPRYMPISLSKYINQMTE